MVRSKSLQLGELIASLSLAMDLGLGFPLEKGLRTTLLAIGIAERLDRPDVPVAAVYYAALLRHLGCTALDYEMGTAYGDAIAARALFGTVDFGRPREAMPHVLRNIGAGQGALERARIVGHMLTKGSSEGDIFTRSECEVGIRLSHRLGLDASVVRALGHGAEDKPDLAGPGPAAQSGVDGLRGGSQRQRLGDRGVRRDEDDLG